MSRKTIIINVGFISLELILGVFSGLQFIENYDGKNMGLNQSIIHFYANLNLIFLGVVSTIGIVNSVVAKKKDRILNAFILSIMLGFIALIIYSAMFSYLSYELNIRRIPLFFTLLAIVLGFNIGLNRERKTLPNIR